MSAKQSEGLTQRLNTALMGAATQKFIQDALPQTVRKYLTSERMARIALAAVSKNTDIWQCSIASIVRAIVDAASLGLEPIGGPLTHGYLVRYGQECQFIISYQGLIELARRSGEFGGVEANAVYEKDKLNLRFGFNAAFDHEPYVGKEPRGEVIGAYCLWTMKGGDRSYVTWMSREDIDKRKDASQTGRKDKGPWVEWYEEMACKTVIKKSAKLWPKTPEFSAAMAVDDGVSTDAGVAASKIFDAELGPPEDVAPAEPRTKKLAAKLRAAAPESPRAAQESESLPLDDEEEQPWVKHMPENEDDNEQGADA